MKPHFIGGLNARSANRGLAGLHHFLDLDIDDAADDVIAAALVRERAELLFHQERGLAPDGHRRVELLVGQQAGREAVIQVVGVVGDFIREIGDLGFQGGGFRLEPLPARGMIVAGVVLGEAFPDFPGKIEAGEHGMPRPGLAPCAN